VSNVAFSKVERQEFTPDYVQGLAQGDEAIERHFAFYFGRFLIGKLRPKLRAQHAIDDVCQETFLRVLRLLRNQGTLDDPARLGGFVNSVCNHVLWEHYRAGVRFTPLFESAADQTPAEFSPESALIDEEMQRQVLEVLDELPSKDREILRLFFFEDLDADEISQLWSLKRGHVRVLLHRAKNRFRKALSQTACHAYGALCNRKKAVLSSTSASLESTA
jgi:RNA polymerase sigma-70 factor (ECF subfamily)